MSALKIMHRITSSRAVAKDLAFKKMIRNVMDFVFRLPSSVFRSAYRLAPIAFLLLVTNTFAQPLPPGLGPQAAEPVEHKNHLIFLQDAPSSDDIQQVQRHLIPIPKKKLCITSLDEEQQTPVCSAPMDVIQHGGIHYDEVTQQLYLVTRNLDTSQRSRVLSLSAFYRLQDNISVHSLPLSQAGLDARLEKVKALYDDQSLLFENCLSTWNRLTGLSEEATKSIFGLSQEDNLAWRFMNQEKHFCRILGLKGERRPLRRSHPPFATQETSNVLIDQFIYYNTSGDMLTRTGGQYHDQMASLVVFYFLLRAYDIDHSISETIKHIQTNSDTVDPHVLAFDYRPLTTEGHIQLSDEHESYKHLRRHFGNLIQHVPNLLSQLRLALRDLSPQPETKDVLTAIHRLLPLARGTIRTLDQALTQLHEFQYDYYGDDVWTQASLEKLNRLYGEGHIQSLNTFEKQALHLGTVGLFKLIKLLRDTVSTLYELNRDRRYEQKKFVMLNFLTGQPISTDQSSGNITDILNTNTFLSLAFQPQRLQVQADDESTNFLFLGNHPQPLTQYLQQAGVISEQLQNQRRRVSLHKGDQRFEYYTAISNDIFSHELFYKDIHALITAEDAEVELAPIFKLKELLRKHPGVFELILYEEIEGLVSSYHAYLRLRLSMLLQQADIQGFLFDQSLLQIPNQDYSQVRAVRGFGLETAGNDTQPEAFPYLSYLLTRNMRGVIDTYLNIMSKNMFFNASHSNQQRNVIQFVRNYLSEEATKKILFGCINELSNQLPANLAYQCEGEEPTSGYRDLNHFKSLTQLIANARPDDNGAWPAAANLAIARIQTGLLIRSMVIGFAMELIMDVARGNVENNQIQQQIAQVSSRIQSQLDEHIFSGSNIQSLSEEARAALAQERVYLIQKETSRYAINRAFYEERLLAQIQSLASDTLKQPSGPDTTPTTLGRQSLYSLKEGKLMLNTVPYPNLEDRTQGYLYMSQEGCEGLGLYTCASSAGVHLIKGGVKTAPYYLDVMTLGPGDNIPLNTNLRESMRNDKLYPSLAAIPNAPTAAAPLVAKAMQYVRSSDGFSARESQVGFPGYTWRVYQKDMEDHAYQSMQTFLSNPNWPRFSMMFQGAYLDKRVMNQVENAQAIKDWTQEVQQFLGIFINTLEEEGSLHKTTWVSESFSPGLTRMLRFKTHVIELPLMRLLKGQTQSIDYQEQLQTLVSRQRQHALEKDNITAEFQDTEGEMTEAQQTALQTRLNSWSQSQLSILRTQETLAKKDLYAFQTLDEVKARLGQTNFHTLRYFPENTEPTWPTEDEHPEKLHIIMHEVEIFQMATWNNEGHVQRLDEPQLVSSHMDQPLIRSHLQGQYQYHPGAIHHVWDTWDTAAHTEEARTAEDPKRLNQNVYIYYDGSHLMALNLAEGIWYRSEGWNRLGLQITDDVLGEGALQNNSLASVVKRKREDHSLQDITPVPYRVWLTKPHSPPFFNPLADEWTYQQVFLTKDGVGADKQRSALNRLVSLFGLTEGIANVVDAVVNAVGETTGLLDDTDDQHFETFSNLVYSWTRNPGGEDRSFVHVKEALAHPGSEYYLMTQIGDEKVGNSIQPHRTTQFTLWKHFKNIEIKAIAGEKQFVTLIQQNDPHPMKEWVFYNLFENAYPHNESMLWTFFTYDIEGTGSSTQAPGEIPQNLQADASDQPLIYAATPLCMTLALEVKQAFTNSSKLMNNLIHQTAQKQSYLLRRFSDFGDISQAADDTSAFQSGEPLAPPENFVGPVILNIMPIKDRNGAVSWMTSDLRGQYTHRITASGRGTEGIHSLQSTLRLSNKPHQPLWQSPQPTSDPTTHVNTWIPGLCLPFNTQGAVTSMAIVRD